jgi:hypothetical protein
LVLSVDAVFEAITSERAARRVATNLIHALDNGSIDLARNACGPRSLTLFINAGVDYDSHITIDDWN